MHLLGWRHRTLDSSGAAALGQEPKKNRHTCAHIHTHIYTCILRQAHKEARTYIDKHTYTPTHRCTHICTGMRPSDIGHQSLPRGPQSASRSQYLRSRSLGFLGWGGKRTLVETTLAKIISHQPDMKTHDAIEMWCSGCLCSPADRPVARRRGRLEFRRPHGPLCDSRSRRHAI